MGYARDFVGAIESVLPAVAKRGVRVIANAGGVNPPACAAAIREVARKHGVSDAGAHRRRHGRRPAPAARRAHRRRDTRSRTWRPASRSRPCAIACCRPTRTSARCRSSRRSRKGANVVITGRSTDTALTMAPLRHEFGWGADDWDRLAAGIIAGHIIECGAQCSGGNCLYDWQNIPDLANVGYPIVEGHADGTFVVNKHPNTGGRISVPSVTEQLVYEMGDPHSYITPDVVADFTSIQLEQAGEDRVRVFGIKGRPATDKLKVSIAYRAGFKAVGTLVYAWPDALRKAQLADRVLRERLDRARPHASSRSSPSSSASRRRTAGSPAPADDPPEVQLRVGVRGDRQGVGRALHARDRAAGAQRPAERHGLRRRPAEGRGDRRLLAGADRQDRRARRPSRCSHEGPAARHRARPLGRQGRHGQRRRHRAASRSGIRCSSSI